MRGKAHASELFDMLDEHGISAVISGGVNPAEISKNHVYILPKDDPADEYVGFELTRSEFAFLCESNSTQESSARAVKSNEKAKKSARKKILSYLELTEGDYVVHELHGVGQYMGIKTLTVAGVTRDYIIHKICRERSVICAVRRP